MQWITESTSLALWPVAGITKRSRGWDFWPSFPSGRRRAGQRWHSQPFLTIHNVCRDNFLQVCSGVPGTKSVPSSHSAVTICNCPVAYPHTAWRWRSLLLGSVVFTAILMSSTHHPCCGILCSKNYYNI
jgi:hypothetical protein